MTVEKRDGRVVQYDDSKIVRAVSLAASAAKAQPITDTQLTKIKKYVATKVKGEAEPIKIDLIHDAVEEALMKNNLFEVEKSYHDCRKERDKKRFIKFDVIKMMESKYNCSHNEHQNANIDENSVGGRMGEASSAYQKEFALDYMISERFVKNHRSFEGYIHDLDKYKGGMHNCVEGKTRIVTSSGIRKINSFYEGQVIEVLNKDGEFIPATVHSYGEQPINIITLKQRMLERTIKATPNHRWILADGTVTESLQIGDKLIQLPGLPKIELETVRDAEMFAFGLVIGDGNDTSGGQGVVIRLCGAKMQYKHILEKAGYTLRSVLTNGDEVFGKGTPRVHKQEFLSSKMWRTLSVRDAKHLFAGYYAADGNHPKNGDFYSITTTDERLAEMIRDISCLAGYHIIREKQEIKSTNYKANVLYFYFRFESFNDKSLWTVMSIQRASKQKVWCVEEPKTHSFVLEGGIVTGNCLSIPFDDLLNNPVTIKSRHDIRAAGSIWTAAQLIIVYFQTQSMVQFGGVSATHLDWTFVPFVRKSFFKAYVKNYRRLHSGVFKLPQLPCAVTKLSIEDKSYYTDQKAADWAMEDVIAETSQAMESLLHNLNTLQSRSGNQLPFTSVCYGRCTLPEGRLVTNALLDAWEEGLGEHGLTPIFPCGIFQYKKGVNDAPGTPNYDLFQKALKICPKRIYPNFSNGDWSVQEKAFEKSQAIKEKTFRDLWATEEGREFLKKVAQLPPDVQETLGFHIEDDGVDQLSVTTSAN